MKNMRNASWRNFSEVLSELDGTGEEEEEEEGGARRGGVRVLVGCVLFLLIVSTLLGNTLVCAAVVKFRHLRSKVTNFFVISLAVSDLCVAVLVMPWEAITEVTGTWLFGSFCGVWIAFDIMCSTASILNLCIISVDRYWAIASPFKYERKMTHRVAFVMIGVAWTLSILISFIPVQLNWHQAGEDGEMMEEVVAVMAALTNSSNASTRAKSCVANLNKTYAISSSFISFYIPVVIMIATYTRIYRIAQTQIRRIMSLERAAEQAQNQGHSVNQQQQHRPNDEASLKSSFKKETKVLKTLSIIMGVFVFCWLPFFVLNCTVPFCDPPCVSDTTFTVFVWFGWANSSLNPVIYAFNADFRRAFATILGCNRICSNNAVEAVNFSNELVSYQHDTTLHKEALVPAQLQQHPCSIHAGCDHLEDVSAQFDEESLVSNGSRSHNRLLLLPAAVQLEDDPEISLETITPFTPVAGLESDALIPGQVQQDG
ncbi:D(1)-like dopamine receptor [Hippoglossus hippoglossus]|uniref:D(1)-like dopamine receptor n=1 Tax=Hippoglossus hippoglossus TaxID=8267 RepID=UPI00148D9919|nr:D(1)-like dopamine receptor [Hippoglossus hippoglossus]XP_035028786.2 D(1)-like dopamine receptor [Hippoglossus stenolepis]